MYELEASDLFKYRVKHLGKAERKKVRRFLSAFQNGGFQAIDQHFIENHRVRNKNSDHVHKDDPEFIAKVSFAIKYKLWHYHAGFYNINNEYPIDNGYKLSDANDLVSQWLIHYQKISVSNIVLVDLRPHPPLDILKLIPLATRS